MEDRDKELARNCLGSSSQRAKKFDYCSVQEKVLKTFEEYERLAAKIHSAIHQTIHPPAPSAPLPPHTPPALVRPHFVLAGERRAGRVRHAEALSCRP